jgi:hypothetical protein
MKRHLIAALAATAVASPLLAWTTTARAQDPNGYYYAPTTVVPPRAESTYAGPNRALLTTGLISFTGAYVPSVIVGAESSQPADHHLYVPVVGPWLDLADRPGCGIRSIGCDRETTNKVLIIASGVFQGAGVLTTLSSFIFPEHSTTVTTAGTDTKQAAAADKPSVHVTPTDLGAGGYGLAAYGGF